MPALRPLPVTFVAMMLAIALRAGAAAETGVAGVLAELPPPRLAEAPPVTVTVPQFRWSGAAAGTPQTIPVAPFRWTGPQAGAPITAAIPQFRWHGPKAEAPILVKLSEFRWHGKAARKK